MKSIRMKLRNFPRGFLPAAQILLCIVLVKKKKQVYSLLYPNHKELYLQQDHNLARMLQLKDIVPAAQNNINTKFIILEKASPALESRNKTCLALVADETAAVHFLLWGEECEACECGDIIRLSSGIFSFHRSNLVLRSGKRGKAEKVGEFTMLFVETPNMSEMKWIPDPNNKEKYAPEAILSTHSRIFPPMM